MTLQTQAIISSGKGFLPQTQTHPNAMYCAHVRCYPGLTSSASHFIAQPKHVLTYLQTFFNTF